jgi:hypothetical protein
MLRLLVHLIKLLKLETIAVKAARQYLASMLPTGLLDKL